MENCEVCGNAYAYPLKIELAGRTHIFDSFECAIHVLAPRCSHCGCTVIGHGSQWSGRVYCCDHCLRTQLGHESAAAQSADHPAAGL